MTTIRIAPSLLTLALVVPWLDRSSTIPEAQAASASFSGHGSSSTGLFHMDAGLVIAAFSHNGKSNFVSAHLVVMAVE